MIKYFAQFHSLSLNTLKVNTKKKPASFVDPYGS